MSYVFIVRKVKLEKYKDLGKIWYENKEVARREWHHEGVPTNDEPLSSMFNPNLTSLRRVKDIWE